MLTEHIVTDVHGSQVKHNWEQETNAISQGTSVLKDEDKIGCTKRQQDWYNCYDKSQGKAQDPIVSPFRRLRGVSASDGHIDVVDTADVD